MTMRILLVEDDPEHADLIRKQISRKHGAKARFNWVQTLRLAIADLKEKTYDVALVDLGLPDSTIHETLPKLLPYAQRVPIVVLSSLDDEDFGLKAVHSGAQDYISKSWMDGELLFRSLRYAIERKAIEEELRTANQTKDEFLATLSHELRTPIGVIQGFAEMLLHERLPDQEKREALEAIFRNSELQVALVNDILDMSKIITGVLNLQNETVDLGALAKLVTESVQLAARAKDIKLTLQTSPSGSFVLGDRTRLQQVLWNLISNAIKFTPDHGSVDVSLTTYNSSVELIVSDTGEGISPDFLPFVFDRFRQEDSSSRRRFGGLGLGLSIAKYLSELHGGRVSAASAGRGQGARFSVVLPSCPPLGASVQKLESTSAKKAPLSKIRILAIDDSSDSLMLLKRRLHQAGAFVLTADSARQARQLLSSESVDLIICDIGMPEEDGLSFINRLRESEATSATRLPAIALTAYIHPEEKAKALAAGFDEHLAKPVSDAKLIETISRLRP